MTKKYMRIISILLISAIFICAFQGTVLADGEQLNIGLDIDTTTQMYVEPDEVIPNPNYKSLEPADMSSQNAVASPLTSRSVLTGVYRIKNVYNGKYLDVRGGGVSAGTAVQQWALDETTRNQLFKITYLSTDSSGLNYYSIRPMTNSGTGLSAPVSGTTRYTTIQTMSLSENLGSISMNMRWVIAESGNYYTIKNGSSSANSYLATPSNSNNGSQTMTVTSSTSTNTKWVLEEYTGDPIEGMAMTNFSNSISLNSTFDFDAIMYSSGIGKNGPVTYSVRNSDGSATDKATINSSTGVLTALKEGPLQVITSYPDAGWIWIWNIEIVKKAIIIVPGIMGSELVAGSNHSFLSPGTKIFSSNMTLEEDEFVAAFLGLRCDSNGNSTEDIVAYNNLYGYGNVYQELYTSLQNAYSDEYEICFFAYDWRLSNEISANTLNTFINTKGYGKVVLVAHSMGGLVASSYLAKGTSQRNKVEKLITLGSPLLGTPVMPFLWGTEDPTLVDDLGLTSGQASTFKALYELFLTGYNPIDWYIGNFQSLYEMFPTEQFFDANYANETYLYTSFLGISLLEIETYSDTQSRLRDYLPKYNSTLGERAEDFNDSLYVNSEHITSLVDSYYIAGYNYSMVNDIHYNMLNWSSYNTTNASDKMVSVSSATLGNRYSDDTYYVNEVNHTQLVTNDDVIYFIINIIDGDRSTSGFANISENIGGDIYEENY